MAEGREGDWECSGCKNRNYAFRSFCNRCKQPRLLVDTKTPPNSKWLPRIGDWICSGCTNNNYASREMCKKCGQPKEVAAMPAIAMPGVFVGGQGGLQPRMGLLGSSTFQQSLPPSSVWPLGAFASNTNNLLQLSSVPKDWRNGDWICNCGFHNYSSRAQCKKCNAAPPALGIKRLATDELVHAWDNKRLNAGAGPEQSYSGFGPVTGFLGDQLAGLHATYPSGSATVAPSMQGAMHLPQLQIAPALVGKGVHVAELNTGEREIGCAQIAITIIMHPDLSVIVYAGGNAQDTPPCPPSSLVVLVGAKLRKLQPLSQLASLDDMFMTVKYCNSQCGRALV